MIVIDFQGNRFKSKAQMCMHYNISVCQYNSLIKKGYTQEEILRGTKKIKELSPHIDHKGNKFNTLKEMCAYWNIGVTTYQHRRNRGWSMEKSLATPVGTQGDKSKKEDKK